MSFQGFSIPFKAFAIGLLLTGLGLMASLWAQPVCAQPIAYSEDFKDGQAQGWQLESAWVVKQNRLTARGHGWARYRSATWENLSLSFLFDASNKGLQANIRASDSGRYIVGFRFQRGFLQIYLFREIAVPGPNSFRNLAQRRIPVRATRQGYRAEISAQGNSISVSVNGTRAFSVRDPDPLPAGIIAFESLADSTAFVDNVTVRAERALVRVPALIGKPLGDVRDRLKEVNLSIGQAKERPAEAKQGMVVDQHPPEGERVPPGSAVNLVVSTGPQQVEVPSLLGLKRGEALRTIREAGLKVGGIRQGDSARDDVVVVDQEPRPATRVANGSAVSITVAGTDITEVPRVVDKPPKAARETVEASRLPLGEDAAPLTLVPDVLKQDARQAQSTLEAAGLQLGKVSERGSREREGIVLEQFPVGGKQIPHGTAVSVIVAARSSSTNWLLPAAVAGLLGVLAGYWGSRGFKGRPGRVRQPVYQITVRVLKDPGKQTQSMEGTASGLGNPVLRCRALPDAGKQQMDVQEAARAGDEDTHVG